MDTKVAPKNKNPKIRPAKAKTDPVKKKTVPVKIIVHKRKSIIPYKKTTSKPIQNQGNYMGKNFNPNFADKFFKKPFLANFKASSLKYDSELKKLGKLALLTGGVAGSILFLDQVAKLNKETIEKLISRRNRSKAGLDLDIKNAIILTKELNKKLASVLKDIEYIKDKNIELFDTYPYCDFAKQIKKIAISDIQTIIESINFTIDDLNKKIKDIKNVNLVFIHYDEFRGDTVKNIQTKYKIFEEIDKIEKLKKDLDNFFEETPRIELQIRELESQINQIQRNINNKNIREKCKAAHTILATKNLNSTSIVPAYI
jgi:hypothetical protein